MVPATLVEIWVFSSSSSLARPKSEILALRFLSSSIFVALMSLWTIFSGDSSCRKAKPLAMPTQIFCLVGQSNFRRPSSEPFISRIIESAKLIKLVLFDVKVDFKCLPNKECARLLFSMYSYTNNSCFTSIQHPCNLTRFGCCKAEIMPISLTNSLFPCFDFEDSCLTAITVPSNNTPCDEKWHSC